MNRLAVQLFSHAPELLLAGVVVCFATLSSRFLTLDNLSNVLVQSSSAAVVAGGMTVVLATGGIDLSVGSVMFLGAAICGRLVNSGWPTAVAAIVLLGIGPLSGLLHGIFIGVGRATPFVVTLATLFIYRGLGLWIGQTRAMNLPEEFRTFAVATMAGIPVPIVVAGLVLAILQFLLTATCFGRHLLAVGFDRDRSHRAGVAVGQTLVVAYVITATCAAVGGLISLAQLGTVSPTFGRERELDAVAAAVLGGTSLAGGRASVVPGALLGTLLLQVIENGLVLINADPYAYPVVKSVTVFLAVLMDRARSALMRGQELGR